MACLKDEITKMNTPDITPNNANTFKFLLPSLEDMINTNIKNKVANKWITFMLISGCFIAGNRFTVKAKQYEPTRKITYL